MFAFLRKKSVFESFDFLKKSFMTLKHNRENIKLNLLNFFMLLCNILSTIFFSSSSTDCEKPFRFRSSQESFCYLSEKIRINKDYWKTKIIFLNLPSPPCISLHLPFNLNFFKILYVLRFLLFWKKFLMQFLFFFKICML